MALEVESQAVDSQAVDSQLVDSQTLESRTLESPTAESPAVESPAAKSHARTSRPITSVAAEAVKPRTPVAMVTGGNSPLGRAVIARLLANGYAVAGIDDNPTDLLGDTRPAPTDRAPDAFRPDPTAVPTKAERESLRPATGPAPSFAADRGLTLG